MDGWIDVNAYTTDKNLFVHIIQCQIGNDETVELLSDNFIVNMFILPSISHEFCVICSNSNEFFSIIEFVYAIKM